MKTISGRNISEAIKPFKNPSHILDVGTGNGRWVEEVAHRYPDAEVIGMDLSPIQPTFVPSNAKFLVGDLTVHLPSLFQQESFDLIHSRMVKLGIPGQLWDRYVAQVFLLLKPGLGWAQFVELSNIFHEALIPPDRPMYQVSCIQCGKANSSF